MSLALLFPHPLPICPQYSVFFPFQSPFSSIPLLPLPTDSIPTFFSLFLIFSSLLLPLNLPYPCLVQLFLPPSLLICFSCATPINHLFLAPLSFFSPGLCSVCFGVRVCSHVHVYKPGRSSVVYLTAFVRPCYREKHSGSVCMPTCGLNIRGKCVSTCVRDLEYNYYVLVQVSFCVSVCLYACTVHSMCVFKGFRAGV